MSEHYIKILKFAIENKNSKLFLATLCSWNFNHMTYDYIRNFTGTTDEIRRIIRLNICSIRLRPLVKKLTVDIGKPISLKCSGEWERIPFGQDFDIRSDKITKWIKKYVYTVHRSKIEVFESELSGKSTDEIIDWYTARL